MPEAADRGVVTGPPAEEAVARGLIVQTTTSTPSDGALKATDEALGAEAEVASDEKLTGKISTIDFDQTVSEQVASEVAAEVTKRSDVVWASPNTLRRHQAASPETPNDPYFPKQQNLWDKTYSLPSGGYSIKAPSFWKKTKGSEDVRVAVLDTGILAEGEPEFEGQLVDGYDMIAADSNPSGSDPFETAGDGDGRDGDPTDPGDWASSNMCYRGAPAEPSSWHGTFVAAQIVAKANNREGIAGAAPGVKVQPVRVLGHCGGYDSDIIAGMTWASGGEVTGDEPVAAQPVEDRSQVINLSLSGYYSKKVHRDQACKAYEAAAASGRSRGSVFIAAAGNQGGDADLAVPASCRGFISVGATSSRGFSSSYSNVGSSVDLVAPGGDTLVEGRGDAILSLGNAGLRSAKGRKYVRYEGTSMATPQVSAAAALYYSLGVTGAVQVEELLTSTVLPFRKKSKPYANKKVRIAGKNYYINLNCTYHWCGAGVLDLKRAQVPLTPPTIVGKAVPGEPLTFTPGRWISPPKRDSYGEQEITYTWMADGTPVSSSSTEYFVRREDEGKAITLSAGPANRASSTLAITSAPVNVSSGAPVVSLTVVGTVVGALDFGRKLKAQISVTDESGAVPADGGTIEIRRGTNRTIARGPVINGAAQIEIPVDAWVAGYNYLRATYVDSAGVPLAASGRRKVLFRRGVSTATAVVPSTIKYGSKPLMRISVQSRVPGYATGLVQIMERGDIKRTVRLPASGSGRVSVRLPAVKRKSAYYTIRYRGTGLLTEDVSPAYRVFTR